MTSSLQLAAAFTSFWWVESFEAGTFKPVFSSEAQAMLLYEKSSESLALVVDGRLARLGNTGIDVLKYASPVGIQCDEVCAVVSSSDRVSSYVKFLLPRNVELTVHLRGSSSANDIEDSFKSQSGIVIVRLPKLQDLVEASHDSMKISTGAPPISTDQAYISDLWLTKSWSDIIIRCQQKVFEVHRFVLCARTKYFATAFGSNFSEGKTRAITLPESEVVVDTVLKHIYGLPLPIFESVFMEYIDQSPYERYGTLENLVAIYQAADKYDLETLAHKTAAVLEIRVKLLDDAFNIVKVAEWVYTNLPEHAASLRTLVVEQIISHFATITEEETAYDALIAVRELTKDVFRRTAELLKMTPTHEEYTPPPSPASAKKSKRRRY